MDIQKTLSQLAIEYQESKKQIILKEIHKRSEGLVWGVIKYYGIFWFPSIVLEDIMEDCRSFILTKSVDRYDPSKGTIFETYYTWWLRSHVLSRKLYYLRRQNIMLTPSIDDILFKEYLNDKEKRKTFASRGWGGDF